MQPYLNRPLLMGASGQLGTALRDALAARGSVPACPPRSALDVRDLARLERRIAESSPSVVLNAAAYTDVARAELPAEQAEVFALNRDVPEAIARACARSRVPMVQVSTDYVFDGACDRPYREDDPTNPLQVYGESKLAGERAVIAAYPEALVVRTSTLFGLAPRARPNYVDAILAQALDRETIEVMEPPVASPTFAPDLAAGILALLDRDSTGIFHLANDGACSRLELARAVVEASGRSDRVDVRPRTAAEGGPRRPPYSALDSARFAQRVGFRPRPWKEAVFEHVRRRLA